LTPEGEHILAEGSHEFKVFDLIGEQGVAKSLIDVSLETGFGFVLLYLEGTKSRLLPGYWCRENYVLLDHILNPTTS
jgi:hypothetical protein